MYFIIYKDIPTDTPWIKPRCQIVDKLDENINWAIPNWYFHFLFA